MFILPALRAFLKFATISQTKLLSEFYDTHLFATFHEFHLKKTVYQNTYGQV